MASASCINCVRTWGCRIVEYHQGKKFPIGHEQKNMFNNLYNSMEQADVMDAFSIHTGSPAGDDIYLPSSIILLLCNSHVEACNISIFYPINHGKHVSYARSSEFAAPTRMIDLL